MKTPLLIVAAIVLLAGSTLAMMNSAARVAITPGALPLPASGTSDAGTLVVRSSFVHDDTPASELDKLYAVQTHTSTRTRYITKSFSRSVVQFLRL